MNYYIYHNIMSIIYNTNIYDNYDPENNRSSKYLSKYEKAKIIGLRAQLIANGSKAFIDVPKDMTNVVDIAEEELKMRKIPFIIKRDIGNNEYEYWKLEDLHY